MVDTIAAHMSMKIEDKQKVLETESIEGRLEIPDRHYARGDGFLTGRKENSWSRKKQMEKSQREYYLNEQIKAIQKELGDLDEVPNELDELKHKIESAGMSKEAGEKALSELNKLKTMSPMSAEATVVRSYIDWMVSVPWKKA